MDNNINTNNVVSTNNVTEASTNNTLNVNNTNDVGNGSNMNNQKPKNNKTIVICMVIIIIILLGIIGFLIFNSIDGNNKNNGNDNNNVSNSNQNNGNSNNNVSDNTNKDNQNETTQNDTINEDEYSKNSRIFYELLDDAPAEVKSKYKIYDYVSKGGWDCGTDIGIMDSIFIDFYISDSEKYILDKKEDEEEITITYSIKYDEFKNKMLTVITEELFNKFFSKDFYYADSNGNLVLYQNIACGGGDPEEFVGRKITSSNSEYVAYELWRDDEKEYILKNDFTMKDVNGNMVINYVSETSRVAEYNINN